MPKRYPWQRWPDRDKKKKSDYHDQKKESTWKRTSIKDLRPRGQPKVIRKKMTRNIAEISEDGKTITIDEHVEKRDVPALVEHEREYWHLRYEHGMSRQEAIDGAIVHERQYVESHGGDWEAYNLRMANIQRNIINE
jgi:hypothetical protein